MPDIEAAVTELRSAGAGVAEVQQNDRQRYAHFVAPDGELYERVQDR